MPELPDVEIFTRYFKKTALHKTIGEVRVNTAKVLDRVSSRELRQSLESKSFAEARRHGKYLLARFVKQRGWLALHFGMTGYLEYFKDNSRTPRHSRVEFLFRNGYRLAFCNQRLLGKAALVDSPEQLKGKKDLGPDAGRLNKDEFRALIRGSRGAVKPALMDQKRLAGLGNIYSDEILFQARVHPKAQSGRLSGAQADRIHEKMRKVVDIAVRKKADPQRVPRDFLLPHRDTDRICPSCGGRFKKIKVSGRSSTYCPRCQKKTR